MTKKHKPAPAFSHMMLHTHVVASFKGLIQEYENRHKVRPSNSEMLAKLVEIYRETALQAAA